MNEINFKCLTNAEIKIKLIELENEYISNQNKIRNLIANMNEIDKAYTEGKKLLDKRTGGISL